MKTFVSSILTAAFVLPGGTATRGQEPPPSAVIKEQVAAIEAGVARAVERGTDALAPALAAVDENLARIQTQSLPAAEAALAEFERGSQDQFKRATERFLELAQAAPRAVAATPAPPGAPAGTYATRLQQIVSRGRPNAGRALVIRSTDSDPKAQANLEEDLAVMARVLDKALEEKLSEDRRHRAMGIDVFFNPGGSPIRSLYLEGYGALFLVNVNFPLLPPPEKPVQTKEKSETNSTWEQARRELYGQEDLYSGAWNQYQKMFKAGTNFGPTQEYDESKVQELKDTILESLKNATNIRNLKSDETITLCVFGGASSPRAKGVVKRAADTDDKDGNEVEVSIERESRSPARGTIMTVRARKSDVDAFAKGKLSLDDFRKKTSIATYPGDGGGWGGGNAFGLAIP